MRNATDAMKESRVPDILNAVSYQICIFTVLGGVWFAECFGIRIGNANRIIRIHLKIKNVFGWYIC